MTISRRRFFRTTLGLLAGVFLPKSLQGEICDVVLLPYAADAHEIEAYYLTGQNAKFITPTKEWEYITIVEDRGPITPVLKEGTSQARAHGSTYRHWVRWAADKPCTVTVGK